MKYSDVAILIPTFNEAGNIVSLVKKILKILPDAKIIVADDDSPDGTSEIVEKSFSQKQNVFLISDSRKQGRGKAVLRGFLFAREKFSSQVYIEMDADHSHEPELLPALVSKVTPETIVCASRYLPESRITNWSRFRIIFSFFSNAAIRFILKSPLADSTNGFRAYPIAAVNILLKTELLTKNYLALAESVKLLTKNGFNYLEIPSHFPNRTIGKSNTNFKLIIQSLKDLLNIWWKYL